MADATRHSALAAVQPGFYIGGELQADASEPTAATADLHININPNLHLHQITFWQEPAAAAAAQMQTQWGVGIPAPLACESIGEAPPRTALRIEPFKCWVVGDVRDLPPLQLPAESGSVLDLSHARTHIAASGRLATTLLNSHLDIDLREQSFPAQRCTATAFHHVGIVIWRGNNNKNGDAVYNLLLPRTFAQSIWELLFHTATQHPTHITTT